MTQPDVASSDATKIGLRIERDGGHYVLNGRRWFSSGARADRGEVPVVMCKTDPNAPRHLQQSMIVVPKDTPGVSIGGAVLCCYRPVEQHAEPSIGTERWPVASARALAPMGRPVARRQGSANVVATPPS